MITTYGRPLTLAALRGTLDQVRSEFKGNARAGVPSSEHLLAQARASLSHWTTPTIFPVINATGVVLHTNLGRAPLSTASRRAMESASAAYCSLEYDLEDGRRGSRLMHAELLLRKLTGAEAALVVNNNAAAVLLALAALANRRRAIVPRTQLVEIGGGFRVPDVMRQSGARLVEVGTTNRVHLRDYEQALREPTALILQAHRSNFQITGFTAEPGLAEVTALAQRSGVPLVHDLGSGALLDTSRFGLTHEPTVQESVGAGAAVVCFSGDKLVGGPQAGIIVGKAELIDRMRRHPLARAVRADKTCLAGLSATLMHYLKDEAEREIPIWRMISLKPRQLKRTAADWARELGQADLVEGRSTVGGGSLPGETLPTFLVSIRVPSPDGLLRRLRQQHPPIVARTKDDAVLIDPRTVLPEQHAALLDGLRSALSMETR
jgi:L-seryl-tRNA(Ser) seleniumtransferase